MEEKVVEKEISAESGFSVEWNGEKAAFRIIAEYDGKGANAGLYIDLEGEYFIRKLAEVIPGEWDDKLLEMLLLALKK